MAKCGCVTGHDCEAPANGPGTIRTKCFACGQPVCRGCSVIRDWHRHQRKRVCDACAEDARADAQRATRRAEDHELKMALALRHTTDRRSALQREERALVAKLFNVRAALRQLQAGK